MDRILNRLSVIDVYQVYCEFMQANLMSQLEYNSVIQIMSANCVESTMVVVHNYAIRYQLHRRQLLVVSNVDVMIHMIWLPNQARIQQVSVYCVGLVLRLHQHHANHRITFNAAMVYVYRCRLHAMVNHNVPMVLMKIKTIAVCLNVKVRYMFVFRNSRVSGKVFSMHQS